MRIAPRRALRRLLLLAFTAGASSILVACGNGGSAASGGCGPVRREALDPSSGTHLVVGAAEPDYLSDPPTSGAHEPGPRLSGVRDEPLGRPAQVGQLEAGAVLLQHGELDDAQQSALEALAGDGVVVAPNPNLPAPIVATAWLFKQTCDTVDAVTLQQFVGDHLGALAPERG